MRLAKKMIILTVLICGIFFANSVDAQTNENNLTITPAKFNLSLSPGDAVENHIRIVNNNDYETLVSLQLENIGLVKEDGEAVIGGTHSGYPSILKDWVKFDPVAVNIKAKKVGFIKITITVPENSGYGGRYASIVAKQAKLFSEDGNNTSNASLASLIMLTIVGDTKYQASVETFSIAKGSKAGFYDVTIRTHNKSNNHINPKGMIVVNNVIGQKINALEFDGENILPGATRRVLTSLDTSGIRFGVYNIVLIAHYGYGNEQVLSASKRIVINPLLTTIIYSLVVLLAIYIIYLIMALIRKRKRQAR